MSWQETNEEAGKCGSEELVTHFCGWPPTMISIAVPRLLGHGGRTGPAARPGRRRTRGSAALVPCSMKAVTCFRHPCVAQTHCSLLKLVSDFALFISVFRLGLFFFFFLASSSSKGNFNMEIEGSKHSLQKSRGCVLAGVGFGKANPYIGSISQVLGLWHLMSPSSPLGFCLVLIHNPGLTFKVLVLCT